MLDKIRLATPAEVNAISAESDLAPPAAVFAFENPKGENDLAVVRQAWEIDPLFGRSGSTARKAAFVWALETWLRLQGAPAYYFQLGTDDKTWREVVEHWGATPLKEGAGGSPIPQFRYKKVLT